jgi:hypothetical protein
LPAVPALGVYIEGFLKHFDRLSSPTELLVEFPQEKIGFRRIRFIGYGRLIGLAGLLPFTYGLVGQAKVFVGR